MGMAWPDDVNLVAAFTVVAVVVGAGAVVVDVVVAGAAVVVVVVTTGAGAGVVGVVGAGVVGVAGFAVDGVVTDAAGAAGLAGVWPEGVAAGFAVLDDVDVVAAVEELDGCSAMGAAGAGSAAAGAAWAPDADFVTSGTPLPVSAAAGTSGTVSSTRMVVSGWPGAPFLVTTCFFVTITTEPGPPESAGTPPALADELNPRMATPESAATEIAPVANTSTPAEADANAFFLNMGETVTIAWLAIG